MEPRTFCDALNREAGDYLLATVLEGAAQGAQLLLCGGVPVWPEHPAACLEAQLPALQQVTASGVQTFGALRVFAERFGAAPRLVVCGGGHVGASVVRLAKLLGLPVCALEDRPEFAGQLRQAGADPVLCLPFEEGLAAVSGGAECYFVVVTRAHSCDVQCLTAILQKPAAYVNSFAPLLKNIFPRPRPPIFPPTPPRSLPSALHVCPPRHSLPLCPFAKKYPPGEKKA